jgi:hypothetical protein
VKFTWRFAYPGRKTLTEVYAAVENALALIHSPKPATTFNPYTGEEEEGGEITTFDLPIPMLSFGIKWSY